MSEFSDLVIRGLVDKDYRDGVNRTVRDLSSRYTWASLAQRLEGILERRLERKRAGE